jgi:hypothetical protein
MNNFFRLKYSKLKINSNFFISLTIIFISLIYSFFVGEGYYGFSNDYYSEYHKSNLIYLSYREKIGSLLSTLTIKDVHLGIHLTSFVLALSSGLLMQVFFEITKKKSLILFLIFYAMVLHIHPIIMSTSGAMRQGWAMSFIFLSIFFFLNKKFYFSILFVLLSIFCHKSGLLFLIIYLCSFIIQSLFNLIKNQNFFLILISLFLFSFLCVSFYFSSIVKLNHRIIAGDFRYLWLIINLSYIIFYNLVIFLNVYQAPNVRFVGLFFYVHASLAPAFLLMGLNWQYERINMIAGLPLLLICSCFFEKKSSYLFLLISLSFYLFITIYQGMYSIGLT